MSNKTVKKGRSKSRKNINDVFYSVVIPVYKSENVVTQTIDQTIAFFERQNDNKGWSFEIILVNDCSPDGSWRVIEDYALKDDRVIAINLGKNYGQHTANIVGFRYASGDCVITMDDDLQNPPSEIIKLAEKYVEGFDLVVGTFAEKKHASHRRLGSQIMQALNKNIFPAPEGFRHTNFRLIDNGVIQRIVDYKNHYPYTSGMAMMFSSNQTNVLVDHHDRTIGQSNYNMKRLLKLSWDIVFNYSVLPIRILVFAGFVISFFSLLVAAFLVIKSLIAGTSGTGWTSLMLVISLSNAVLFLLLSIIGEYLAVISQQVRMDRHFFISDVVGTDKT